MNDQSFGQWYISWIYWWVCHLIHWWCSFIAKHWEHMVHVRRCCKYWTRINDMLTPKNLNLQYKIWLLRFPGRETLPLHGYNQGGCGIKMANSYKNRGSPTICRFCVQCVREFINHFSLIVAPLTNLTKIKTCFKWTLVEQDASQKLFHNWFLNYLIFLNHLKSIRMHHMWLMVKFWYRRATPRGWPIPSTQLELWH